MQTDFNALDLRVCQCLSWEQVIHTTHTLKKLIGNE